MDGGRTSHRDDSAKPPSADRWTAARRGSRDSSSSSPRRANHRAPRGRGSCRGSSTAARREAERLADPGRFVTLRAGLAHVGRGDQRVRGARGPRIMCSPWQSVQTGVAVTARERLPWMLIRYAAASLRWQRPRVRDVRLEDGRRGSFAFEIVRLVAVVAVRRAFLLRAPVGSGGTAARLPGS